MKSWDIGLGIVGLAALATAMAVLLTIGIPIILAPEPVKVSDWLGFAGNVLGSGTALVAATIAWRAVQSQIDAQREQVLIGVLVREEDRAEQKIRAMRSCVDFLDRILSTALESREPARRWYQINEMGLSDDIMQIRRAVMSEINFRLDEAWIAEIVNASHHYVKRLKIENDELIRYQSGQTPSRGEFEKAHADTETTVDELAEFIMELKEDVDEADQLRQALRNRIDTTVRGLNPSELAK